MSDPARPSKKVSMWSELAYLLRTFDSRSRRLLVVNIFVQFIVALMDLLGMAAIYPLMQVAMGASISSGALGKLHHLLGNQSERDFTLTLAGLMAVSFLLKAVLSSALQWWSSGLVTRLQTRTARNLLQRYMAEEMLTHRKRNTGEVIRTVGPSTQAAHQNVLGGLISISSSLLSVILIGALLIAITPMVAILAILYFGIAVFVIQRVLAPANRRAGEVAQHTAWVSSKTLMESMLGFREATLHDVRPYFLNRFDSANRLNAEASRKANFLALLPKNILEFTTMVGLTVLIVATVLAHSAASTMPTLSLFAGATVKILPLMVAMTAMIGAIRFGRDGLHLTVTAMKEFDERPVRPGPSAARAVSATCNAGASGSDLHVDGVSFRYEESSPNVLENIDLTIPAGSSLALCGPSGSGKTTLVDIILGLISPSAGEVTYDGLRTDSGDPRWYEAVAYVPQDVYLLDDTVANNIAFGIAAEDQDRDKIRDCLARAELLDVIDTLPEGLDTQIGERGTRFSGGQRQRMGIARALYRDPSVIVFDEATSALDNATEHRITKTINSLRGQITTVIVAHRLSTVRNVDTLAFLQNGRIEALGSFDEVQRQSPSFARLVELGQLEGTPTAVLDQH